MTNSGNTKQIDDWLNDWIPSWDWMSKVPEARELGAAALWLWKGGRVFGMTQNQAGLDLCPSFAIHQLWDLKQVIALSG